MKTLLKNGTILDFSSKSGYQSDILIDGSNIRTFGTHLTEEDALVIDLTGKIVVPGLIDVHVHFRQPGQEHKETIRTGSRAAAAGGFTTVIAEPNTVPPIDTPSQLRRVLKISSTESVISFYSKACISQGMRGKKLVNVKALKNATAVAISDDGHPVPYPELMKNALEKGKLYDMLVNPHCEESELYRQTIIEQNGQKTQPAINPGWTSILSENPYNSETTFIKRDIDLAEKAGARIHISHVSCAKSVEEIAKAKKRGVAVTCEATPHHFLLTEKDAKEIGTNAKVNPPLRTEEDVAAIQAGLADGTIDVIATDHAPHTPQEKDVSEDKAPFGIIGLETALGLVLTYLVKPGKLTLAQAIEKMSTMPARIFSLPSPAGRMIEGEPASFTVIDLERKWKVNVDEFYSKGRNCPFNGRELQGKAVLTVVRGRIVMKEGEIIDP